MIAKFVFSTLFHKPVIQKIYFKSFTNYELTQLYVDFFACFFLRLFFRNYGTVGIGKPLEIRLLSGRSFSRSLSLFASAVQ
ncbi:hypothetical protein HanPI659440_Chr01g0004781 [Helianthus annuus]|nr:hypothetical protein HanPI659440_Chr01g0004781 [Helianthus annuus]